MHYRSSTSTCTRPCWAWWAPGSGSPPASCTWNPPKTWRWWTYRTRPRAWSLWSEEASPHRRAAGEALDLWRKQRKNKLSSDFRRGDKKTFVRPFSPDWITLLLFYIEGEKKKFLDIYFLSFLSFFFFVFDVILLSAPVVVFKLKWGKSSSV